MGAKGVILAKWVAGQSTLVILPLQRSRCNTQSLQKDALNTEEKVTIRQIDGQVYRGVLENSLLFSINILLTLPLFPVSSIKRRVCLFINENIKQ